MYGHPRRSRLGSGHSSESEQALRRIDRAVVEAHADLLAKGEHVSAWKVAQAAMLSLHANSWDSLGFPMQRVTPLFRIMLTEGKVISFIHCFVGVQSVTSLYDMEMAICESEGVQRFEELELGPLLRHPLVLHYFSVGSGVTEAFKITTGEILSFLNVLMWKRRKRITPPDLLEYIATRKKIDKENLCLRIQSLGMYINRILSARRAENVLLQKCVDALEAKEHDNDDEHHENMYVQSSEKISSQNMNMGENEASCSDPSVAEDKPQIWLDTENDVCHSSSHGSIRINDHHVSMKQPILTGTVSVLHERPVRMPNGSVVEPHLLADNCKDEVDEHTSLFIKLWRDTCRDNDVRKVLEQMLDYYHKRKKKKKMPKGLKMFLTYPHAGLLNVAVASIKLGMWDNVCEASQGFSQQELADTTQKMCAGDEKCKVEEDRKDDVAAAKFVTESEHGVSVEDILKNVCKYLEFIDDFPGNENHPPGKKLIFLRKLCKCESWLTEQFSIKDFNSLGFGDFFTFLAKNESFLPRACQEYFLTDDTSQKPLLEATMSQHHLGVFLSQASAGLKDNENLNKQKVLELLMMQFPSACFTIVDNGPSNNFMDSVIENITNVSSGTVLFSATLVASDSDKSHSDILITTQDAIEVLLAAPMLIDLNSWAFWDLKFAPYLGPLVKWLLTEVKTKELTCLITKGGKVLRLDHSATLNSFLEAFIDGSSFQTAVKLLSLFTVYGAEKNLPVSLLKCHAEKAFAFLLKGSTDTKEDVGKKYVLGGIKKSRREFGKTIPLASRFTLECLGYLPEEFRSFAANVLLTGFQALVKDAPSAILAECKSKEDYLILHELGSSLGIVEWINDGSTLSLSLSNKSSEPDGEKDTSKNFFCPKNEELVLVKTGWDSLECNEDQAMANRTVNSGGTCGDDHIQHLSELQRENNSKFLIESIRREEFGLDPNITASENSILKKQHARLGRALHCLSQELYSQDSHFLLELVQNADDNVYPRYVEPTLIFILQETGIIVLNNEQGFSTENIRALCDVGNSTKKGSAGYIGKKGIGFKSVFRVTDAPEIHSNGFHIKFDLSEGQIGFVLPTIVPPCDVDLFSSLVSTDAYQTDRHLWNTCIVLPFRSKLTEAFSIDNITSMFSDLHPSLLLFLHRLECIMLRNTLTNSFTIMRKEIVGGGIVNVSFGKEKLTWFVESQKMHSDLARDYVQTTQISLAFALEVSSDGTYTPKLDPQNVFAFLPLRAYGLKFIIQGDFILPSSREEVDGDSPWNQWLLSEFPNLFVRAERSFCSLPAFKKNPGIGISAFMSFVPLVGEVHGFFSSLPCMIISKLCTSTCLLLEGDGNEWVPPCKVLRNWTEQVRTLLPDSLLFELLGLGYLDKDIVLSDSLARAIGIEEYGPKFLFQIISSLCCRDGGIKSVGLKWLSSWLNALYETSFHNNKQSSLSFENSLDAINNLRKIPFIPLLDGKYGSISEGAIWMNIDVLTGALDNVYGLKAFPNLFAKLRIVNPALFYGSVAGNLSQILYKVGVQRLSTHEVVKAHVLPAMSDEKVARGNKDLMMEYLCFVMVHLQSSCPNCSLEREHIISEVYKNALILTNHGYKRLSEVPIHFSEDFGNSIDISKLVDGINVKWFFVDTAYLKYPLDKSSSREMLTWRTFLKEIGVSDFVRVVQVEKTVDDMAHAILNNVIWVGEILVPGLTVQDWESQELVHLLSQVSSSGDQKRCKYLLKILDTIWDDYFSDKDTAHCNIGTEQKVFKSSLVSILNDVRWIASSVDNELHYPGDLFHDCEAVRSLLGDYAPYAVPKVHNKKLATHIGFKIQVTSDDILSVLDVWRSFGIPFKASVSQMSKFCTFIWDNIASSKQEIFGNLRAEAFIFVPFSFSSAIEEVIPGVLLSPQQVYWHDDTGSVEEIEIIPPQGDLEVPNQPLNKMLCKIYPGLHDFFVDHCGVSENPPPLDYFQILLRLSTVATPSQASKKFFQVFLEWADGLKSGVLNSKDVEYLKESLEKKESAVLPTSQDKWVSLHPSFGFVCWCDDEKMINEFEGLNIIDFLSLCELSEDEKTMLRTKVSVLMQRLGIPCLSEVVTREAIYYGAVDNSFETSLLSWAFPYAQRYIHNAYPSIYSQLKQSGFANLNRLCIVVVERLFFRNVIKRSKIASAKRFESNCLLQGNVLYITPESGSHSIFMELSSFLLDGIPDLPLANFLHMITTMVESGSTEEQTELFILNSQKVPKLPQEEQVWSFQPIHGSEKNPVTTRVSRMIDEPCNSNSSRKAGANSNWPPVNWRTAPKLSSDPNTFISTSRGERNKAEKIDVPGDDCASIEIDTELTIGEYERLSCTPGVSLENSKALENEIDGGNDSLDQSHVTDREQLSLGTANENLTAVTGKRGELVAFKHLTNKHGEKHVKWMNDVTETGLPYDIVVGDEETGLEYIEVKTTTSTRKDWFEISTGEYQFAVEKGESFSIVHVVLLGKSKARVSTYKNPEKLCRLGKLQLAVLMPRQEKYVSVP